MQDDQILQAIIDNPEDDIVRLIYADWLEECGESDRAELIRIQCEAEEIAKTNPFRARQLNTRARKLLAQKEEIWLGRLYGSLRDRVYRRGFLFQVRILASALLKNMDKFLELGPIHHVTLEGAGASGYLAQIAKLHQLSRIRSWNLRANLLNYHQVESLVCSSCVENARRLDLGANPFGNPGAKAVANSKYLTNLETLGLDHTQVTDDGFLALAESENLPRLRFVNFNTNFNRRRKGAKALWKRLQENEDAAANA
ncbi:MAG: TIGR02996 domain-containing protein [Planctomycetaceae bacterium]|nr:TIGR02996 domain-containing protein [Planctomycetaceae bacterium]